MRSSSFLSPPPSPYSAPIPLASSSSLTRCPELDLSVTLSPAPKRDKTAQRSDRLHSKTRAKTQAGKKRNKQTVCFEEPVDIPVTPNPCVTLSKAASSNQPVRGQRRSRGHHHAPRLLVKPPVTASNQDPSCLERVELNTTLAFKAELQSLQGAEFNPQKAIQETLQRSERTKNLINTKATEVVNVSRSQHLFTSLISVNVEQDELISQALQERLMLAPSSHSHDKTTDGPSLLPFMTSDLFRQKPLPPLEEPLHPKPRPSTCPAHSAFDLYRRQSRWEAAP